MRLGTAMVASYEVDTCGLKAERSRDVWREVVDGTYELEHMSKSEGGHRVATRVWPVEDLLFSTLKAEANTVIRTKALISSNPTPIVKIRAYRYGRSQLTSETASCTYGAGAIHFLNHDFVSRQTSTDHEQISVFVPYHAIDYDPAIHPNAFSIGLDTAAGRLLEASLNAAFLELDQLDKKETPAFVSSFMGTLRGALSGAVDSLADNDVRRARLSAMKRFINLNLHDTTLNADRLMSEFSLSRATLFRDFADIGGINRYLTTCRIQRAY